ncbi:aldehyde dehydrogenase family protein [Alkalimonas delamerensis]|uniref:Aldehyde dehydrogenase n=1 Tax=Alkalimonas delamerensis TaxID=265981 RepID=A0ABT9GMI5_9GAMM|nr:aldehyde dehydrogenase family protein [Alkalimonas delamerensis]MDP4528187.1 aldehyde dehydrogenase family protein [Alkalimonas delamerensis]
MQPADNSLELQQAFSRQQGAARATPYPNYQQRQQDLDRLEQALKIELHQLTTALSADFGKRSAEESLRIELLPALQNLAYQRKQLKGWMKPERRHTSWLFQPARNRVHYQPKGVVGIVVPWNYPVFLAISPLVAALAAGNKVMLKLSEDTPATNRCLRQLLNKAFPAEQVAVFDGDAAQAAAFAALPFDHLLFTGSTAVGRKVMQAAAANLTPVTLELGGKSPAIVAKDAKLTVSAERLVFGKCANAGQTCVAPDYLWVAEPVLEPLLAELQAAFRRLYPAERLEHDYSWLCTERQRQRMRSLLQQAEQAGATIISCGEASWQHYLAEQDDDQTLDKQQQRNPRLLPLQLVLNLPESNPLLQEEIFGPILPIRSYQQIEHVFAWLQQQPRPLALYLFSQDAKLQQQVLLHSHSGGVGFNDCLMQVAQDDLPFGGIGASGIGAYHGKEGFLTFSHAKAVHAKGWWHPGKLIYPPYTHQWLNKALRWLLR